jgi:hypothetical protein
LFDSLVSLLVLPVGRVGEGSLRGTKTDTYLHPGGDQIRQMTMRNRRSVANLNTLIYLIMNVRALDLARSMNRGLLLLN